MDDRNNVTSEEFDKETDCIIGIVRYNTERLEAEARARLAIAVEAEAAKYKQHRRQVRKFWHWLNQCTMMLTGILMLITVILCLHDAGWWTLLFVLGTLSSWTFSRFSYNKSRAK